jgi:glutathione S-transferase
MLTLYHAPNSRSSRIVWLLEELGADYAIEYVNIPRDDGSGAPDTANPHPESKVPTLVHDGVVITESAAIVLYLTDLYPDTGIGPSVGHVDRGPYLSWLAYYAGVIEPVVHFDMLGLGDNPVLYRNFRGRAEMNQRISDALARSSYIAGEDFSGADVLIASLGFFMRELLPEGGAIDDYLARMAARPAHAAALAKDTADV